MASPPPSPDADSPALTRDGLNGRKDLLEGCVVVGLEAFQRSSEAKARSSVTRRARTRRSSCPPRLRSQEVREPSRARLTGYAWPSRRLPKSARRIR
jgi:hypothetical protein